MRTETDIEKVRVWKTVYNSVTAASGKSGSLRLNRAAPVLAFAFNSCCQTREEDLRDVEMGTMFFRTRAKG